MLGRPVDSDAQRGPTSGVERELEQLEDALDALGRGAGLPGRRGRARDRQDAAAGRAARRAPRRAGTSSLPALAAEFERDIPFSVWVDALDAYVAVAATSSRPRPRRRRARRPSWPGCCPSCGGRPRPTARSPTSATARTARCATCSSCWPRDAAARARARRPALGRRRVGRADRRRCCAAGRRPRCSSRSPFRRGQAPAARRVSPRLARGGRADRAGSARPRRKRRSSRADRSASRSSSRDVPPGRRQPVLPRAARALGRYSARGAGGDTVAPAADGVPRRRRRGARRRARAALGPAARAARWTARQSPASRSSPSSPPPSARSRSEETLRGARRAARSRARPPDRGAAALRLPPPARAAGGVRVDARPAGGSRRTDAPRRRSPRTARRPSSALTTSSTRRRRATSEAIALLLQAGRGRAPRAPAAPRAGTQAALRLMPDADVAGRVAALVELAAAQRSLGDLERCRANLLEAISLAGPGRAGAADGADLWLRRGRELHGSSRASAQAADAPRSRSSTTRGRPPR